MRASWQTTGLACRLFSRRMGFRLWVICSMPRFRTDACHLITLLLACSHMPYFPSRLVNLSPLQDAGRQVYLHDKVILGAMSIVEYPLYHICMLTSFHKFYRTFADVLPR